LLVYRTLHFDEERTTSDFFAQNPPILDMRLCEKVLVNIALNVAFMSVDPTFAVPTSALLKGDATSGLGDNLLSSHFYGDFLAKQEQTTADYLDTTPDALCQAVVQFTAFPLLIAFATAIMIPWHLESIGEAGRFCLGLLRFVDFSIFSPFRKALPSFTPQVVFQLHHDTTVAAVNSAIEVL
jgi:hypothetical protein